MCSTAMCIAAVICVMRLFSMMIAALCANIRVPMSIVHSGFFRLENNVFLFPLRFFFAYAYFMATKYTRSVQLGIV